MSLAWQVGQGTQNPWCPHPGAPLIRQVTAFVALLALDTARLEAGRLDLMPFLSLPAPSPASAKRKRRAAAAGEGGGGSKAPRARSYGGVDPLLDGEFDLGDTDDEPMLQVPFVPQSCRTLYVMLERPVTESNVTPPYDPHEPCAPIGLIHSDHRRFPALCPRVHTSAVPSLVHEAGPRPPAVEEAGATRSVARIHNRSVRVRRRLISVNLIDKCEPD